MFEPERMLIRRPLLTGHQQIDGLWFAGERFDEGERRRLILDYWQTGARAYRFADGDLLQFHTPCPVHCESLHGWPLIRQGRGLSSAALHPDELQGLAAADLWLVRGSQVDGLQLRDAHVLTPGLWLDISTYTLLDTFDCHTPLTATVPDAVVTDLREILGGPLEPVSPEREAVMQALLERQRHTPSTGAGASSSSAQNNATPAREVSSPVLKIVIGLVLVGGLIRLFGHSAPAAALAAHTQSFSGMLLSAMIWMVVITALLYGLNRFLHRGASAPAKAAPRPVAPASASPGIAARATPRRHKPAAWRRLLTRLTQHSQLSKLYGKRQAAYMQRMLEMFEEGNFEEALRHAIPLNSGASSGEQSFGTPQRREDLNLSQQDGPARSMLFEEDLAEHLRQVYRQTFERLDRAGRIEEAVFVLAELLKERQQALDYLEKHARYQQAADLALAWDMPPAVIVRLLCLAEQWQRAVLVARRDNAFADAVVMLQAKSPQIADRLRLEWAESLIAKGLWLQAVDVIWSLPAERPRAAQWLLNAEAAGGRLAIGALVKRAILLPETLHAYGPWVEQLRDDPERAGERAALAQALLLHKSNTTALAWLAGATVHAILADQFSAQGQLTHNQLQALVKMSQDKLLQADLPGHALKRAAVVSLDRLADTREWSAPAAGNRPLFDAVPLDDERYLVALGEAGVMVLDATGATLFHFAVPAQKIVIAHSRQVALVLIRRGSVWRISKLDLVNRVAKDLGVLAMDVFANEFDGCNWTIGKGQQLRVVDVDRALETLWHVSDLPESVRAINVDEYNEYLWLSAPGGCLMLWHYRLPERRLVSRESAFDIVQTDFQVPSATAESAQYRIKHDDGIPTLVLKQHGVRKRYRLPGNLPDEEWDESVSPFLFEDWLLISYRVEEQDTCWHVIHRASDRLCVTLHWPQSPAQLRRLGADLLLFDEQGRLSHINIDNASQRNISLH
ncbi:bpX6 domain-containing protein [Pseudomonas sp. O64]|uniref:bpX6 domain-containing protein n=1 Tax=unclassified Pseudomonas TaxID=196821 RepID=UPI00387A9FFE